MDPSFRVQVSLQTPDIAASDGVPEWPRRAQKSEV